MRPEDIRAADASTVSLDAEILDGLRRFGFIAVRTALLVKSGSFAYTITAIHSNGTNRTWIGMGNSPEDAQLDAVDALARWVLGQIGPGQTSVRPATP